MKMFLLCAAAISFFASPCESTGEVVYATNCGGSAHTDLNGIRYEADEPDMVGTTSDFGRSGTIRRIAEPDQVLYQTERYHSSTFSYDIPVDEDGEYVLILKFAEVYFTSSEEKVFDVRMNGHHTVVRDLDIFEKVGRGVAHDEYIPFQIEDGQLVVFGESSQLHPDGSFTVDFVKGDLDNPKINAIAVLKGTLKDVPKLPEWPPAAELNMQQQQQQQQQQQEDQTKTAKAKFAKTSGPMAENPYDATDGWLLPIFIAIGLFIPTVICLCRTL